MSVTPHSSPAPIESWEVLDLLTSLVQKSLVVYEEDAQGQGRYRLLETIRQYSRDRLLQAGEAQTMQQRHAESFLDWAEQWDQAGRLDRMGTEHDNVRAALVWTQAEGHDEMLLRLAAAVRWFWRIRGPEIEGRQWLEQALARSRDLGSTPLRASVLHIISNFAYGQCDFKAANAFGEQLLDMQIELGNQSGIAECYWHMGLVARDQGEYDRARSCYQRSLTIREEIGEQRGIANVLNHLGYLTYLEGDCRTGRKLLEQSIERSRQLGDKYCAAVARYHLAQLADTEGSYSEAEALLKESMAYWQEVGFKVLIGELLCYQGRVALHSGDPGRARSQSVESLVLFRQEGNRVKVPVCLESLGGVCAAEQRLERAARLFAAAAALREALRVPIPTVHRGELDSQVDTVRAALGEAAFATAWSEGRAMTLEDAVNEALKDEADG